ncbi:MAG: Hpt domain-containing protein, partial [Nitrospirae bacterium]|nr:Hpt domain-containing protein [Nitrospirota bacterium]
MEIDRKMILQTFLAETLEHIGQMEESLVGLELQPDDDEAIQNIFRGAHTLKGNSSSLGFPRIAEVAHALEDVLQRFRDKTITVTGDLITLMLQTLDALGQMISNAVALDETGADPEELTPQQTELLKRLKTSKLVALENTQKIDPLYADSRRQRPFGRRPEDAKAWIDSSKTLRVNIAKLDRMLNLAGEITIGRGRLSQMMEDKGRTREDILEAHRQGDMRFVDLQELIMKIRMVPIGPMFRQYIRAVRDVAQTSRKIARLAIEGANAEVDTTVIEHLKGPLTHMIRNAMDHGIEPPEKRKKA